MTILTYGEKNTWIWSPHMKANRNSGNPQLCWVTFERMLYCHRGYRRYGSFGHSSVEGYLMIVCTIPLLWTNQRGLWLSYDPTPVHGKYIWSVHSVVRFQHKAQEKSEIDLIVIMWHTYVTYISYCNDGPIISQARNGFSESKLRVF